MIDFYGSPFWRFLLRFFIHLECIVARMGWNQSPLLTDYGYH